VKYNEYNFLYLIILYVSKFKICFFTGLEMRQHCPSTLYKLWLPSWHLRKFLSLTIHLSPLGKFGVYLWTTCTSKWNDWPFLLISFLLLIHLTGQYCSERKFPKSPSQLSSATSSSTSSATSSYKKQATHCWLWFEWWIHPLQYWGQRWEPVYLTIWHTYLWWGDQDLTTTSHPKFKYRQSSSSRWEFCDILPVGSTCKLL
jgi:hypothetical protein